MNLTQCSNGHYYDGDKYSACPHCGGGAKHDGVTEEQKSHTQAQASEDSHVAKQNNVDFGADMINHGEKKKGIFNLFSGKKNHQETGIIQEEDKPTERIESSDVSSYNPTSENRSFTPSITPEIEEKEEMQSSTSQKTQPVSQMVSEQMAPEKPSLQDSYRMAAVDQDDVVKTIGAFGGRDGNEPVVGWLVAMTGPNRGTDYTLVAGKNTIGRSSMMDVVIVGDQQVSRDKHTTIMFDPMSRSFYLLANESNGMVYYNGEILLENKKLQDHDEIKIGGTVLVFVPFCNDRFMWDAEEE